MVDDVARPAAQPRSDRRPLVLLAFALGAEIVFLLAVPRYVTVDGATHLGSAALIRDIIQGVGAVHLRYVDVASFPAPNILPEIALGLVMLVLDPAMSEKLLQIACVVLLPLALLYAVRSIRRDRDWFALLALPLTFSFAFQFGFYDFTFGVGLFLVAAGYLWRHREAPGWRSAMTFGLLALLVYLTHAVPFLELVVFGAVVLGERLVGAARSGGLTAAGMAFRSAGPLLLATLPSGALAAVFFLATRSAEPAEYLSLPLQVIGVLGMGLGLVTTDRLEVLIAVGLALTLLVLFLGTLSLRFGAAGRAVHGGDVLLAYAVIAVVLACLAPASVRSGGSYIPERLALFPVYGLALWLAGADLPRWSARVGVVVWPLAAAAVLLLRLPTTLSLSNAAIDYESIAPCIATGATMIQVNLARLPSGSLGRTDPFLAEAGRIAAATRGHDIGNFEGTFPFSLFQNRAENDPSLWLLTRPDGFAVPPGVDLDGFRARPDGVVDYVLVVARARASVDVLAGPGWDLLRGQLGAGYRRVAVSPGGLVEAWERTDPALVNAGAARRSANNCPSPAPS